MLENHLDVDTKVNLNRAITEKTRPETASNQVNAVLGYNNLNSVLKNVDDERCVQYINIQRMETAKINNNNIVKDISPKDDEDNKNNLDLYFLPKRLDRFGCPITKGGKQRVTFIDKITKSNFYEVVKIESFKDYNKMEEIKSSNHTNTCCVII